MKGEKGDRGLPGLPGQKGDRVSDDGQGIRRMLDDYL
jgi:hypothetical protein